VPRFVGMFAIAVWDGAQRTLFLIRDRLGKKPLFIHSRPGTLLFGSELKALRAGPGFDARLDPAALTAYLRYLYVPSPACIYQNVIKLPPGHLIAIRDVDAPLPQSRAYWSVEGAAAAGLAAPFPGSETDAVDELERLLQEAVDLRLQSDVPLGALLSGGIDSSTVVALMRARATGTVKTFTIGFDVAAHDESEHAAAVAAHLGTDHTALRLTGADALAVVPRLPRMFDEPLADPSQIPTFLVCQLARRDVTVALTGDGGDELFGGYNRYTYGARMLPWAAAVPRRARRMVAAGLGGVSSGTWDRLVGSAGSVFAPAKRLRLPGAKATKLARLLAAGTPAGMYRSLVSAWDDPQRLVMEGDDRPGDLERILAGATPPSLLDRMMLADQMTYLADDLLAKVDRASMAVSLEARVPLLDHRVVEFAWRIPNLWKVRGGQGKWLLRQLLYRHVPRALIERPKVGFSVPIDVWLNGPLRPWAEDLLAADRLRRGHVLHVEPVRELWRRFLAGDSQLAAGIWSILSYQAWEDEWLPGSH
jgi:asparagine synthase (glutamine-hydrolysing)